MRKNLKMFRVRNELSQEQIAEKIGCTRSTFSSIEIGKREGRRAFWNSLQSAFNIPDEEMFGLMKNE